MSDPEAFSDCALKLAPRDPRVLAGEESAYGPLFQAKRAGTGAEEALFLAETFPCQVTAYRPFSHLNTQAELSLSLLYGSGSRGSEGK